MVILTITSIWLFMRLQGTPVQTPQTSDQSSVTTLSSPPPINGEPSQPEVAWESIPKITETQPSQASPASAHLQLWTEPFLGENLQSTITKYPEQVYRTTYEPSSALQTVTLDNFPSLIIQHPSTWAYSTKPVISGSPGTPAPEAFALQNEEYEVAFNLAPARSKLKCNPASPELIRLVQIFPNGYYELFDGGRTYYSPNLECIGLGAPSNGVLSALPAETFAEYESPYKDLPMVVYVLYIQVNKQGVPVEVASLPEQVRQEIRFIIASSLL